MDQRYGPVVCSSSPTACTTTWGSIIVPTMANCYMLLGYPLFDIPSVERARGWVS
jgi:hypothetical protein